jgi:hypothetical protein
VVDREGRGGTEIKSRLELVFWRLRSEEMKKYVCALELFLWSAVTTGVSE